MRGQGGGRRESQFEGFYRAHYQEIAGYVRRRVAAGEADDVIAHAFTVAWRRFDQIPSAPDDRLWIFGVARNSVAEHSRAQRRRHLLNIRLAQHVITEAPCPLAGADPRFEPVLAAIKALRPAEREALQLVIWEELSHAEAAAVLHCSVNAFELRYRRARNAVRDAVAARRPADDPAVSTSGRTTASAVRKLP